MFQKLLGAAASVAIVAPAAFAQDVTLKVGDPAPQLEHVEWIKGDPVKEFEEGEIYVLDFWATWCGPCVASIPHINELQQEYKDDKVNVIGVAIWPNSRMTPTDEFVEARGDGMDYRIVSDVDRKTADAYMSASGQNGIPTVMAIDREGKIAWIGHPMNGLDVAVELLVNDEFTQERMDEEMDRIQKEEAERQAKIAPVMQRVQTSLQNEDWVEAEKALTELLDIEESFMQSPAPSYLYVAKAKQGKREEARKYAADLMSSVFKDDAQALNGLAWTMVGQDSPLTDEERDAELAVTIAEKAVELTKRENADILDTLARCHFMNGDLDAAVATQREVVEKAGDDAAFYQTTLDEYEAAANAG